MEKAEDDLEIIRKYFTDFTPKQLDQLADLRPLYTDWNSKINLISRKDIAGLYEKHVLHSLSIAACFSFEEGQSILDLGTGGGFPGIPLAILFPSVQFLLVDSIGKKVNVASSIASSLGLENVETIHGRAEAIRGRRFDFVVSRAVAPLRELWSWSRPLLRPAKPTLQGQKQLAKEKGKPQSGLISLKGGHLEKEIKDSGCRPQIFEIHQIFPEPFFLEKYIVFVPLRSIGQK